MTDARLYPAEAMRAFMRDALVTCGLPEADAGIVAARMVEADLAGFDAHGIFLLPSYCERIRSGKVNRNPAITVVRRRAGTALLDGDNGMGHLVVTRAADLAIEMARETGIGWVGLRRSNHAGAAGVYVEMPVRHGMIGLYAAISSGNHMAPWGGAEALLGTNPVAIGIPSAGPGPFVLDIATSVSSMGNIRRHRISGRPIPEGWVVNSRTGEPILDPNATAEGVLLPIGGHKGSGLAIALGLLGGVLNGAAFGRDATGSGPQSNTGQFMAAIDVAAFMDLGEFESEVDRHLDDMRRSQPLPGFDRVRTPGADRAERHADRAANGIPLVPQLVRQLDELAGQLKLASLGSRQ